MIHIEKQNDDVFKVSYKGLDYRYAYKLNALRPWSDEGFTPEELLAPPHPRTPIVEYD